MSDKTLADRMEHDLRTDVEDDETVSNEAIARVRRIATAIDDIVGDERIAAFADGEHGACLVLMSTRTTSRVCYEVACDGVLVHTTRVSRKHKVKWADIHTIRENAEWAMGDVS